MNGIQPEAVVSRDPDLLSSFARWCSWIFIPPAISLLTFTLLVFSRAEKLQGKMILISFLFATAFPLLFVGYLRWNKKLSRADTPIREERTLPYIFGILSYAVGAFLLIRLEAPLEVWGLMCCYSINTLVTTGVNFRWKISAHMMGIAGPLAILTLVFGWRVIPFYLSVPLVGWSRIRLGVHTLSQVIGGTLLGYLATLLELILLIKFVVVP